MQVLLLLHIYLFFSNFVIIRFLMIDAYLFISAASIFWLADLHVKRFFLIPFLHYTSLVRQHNDKQMSDSEICVNLKIMNQHIAWYPNNWSYLTHCSSVYNPDPTFETLHRLTLQSCFLSPNLMLILQQRMFVCVNAIGSHCSLCFVGSRSRFLWLLTYLLYELCSRPAGQRTQSAPSKQLHARASGSL